jgi:ATP-dependent RNA helicase DBP3
MHTAGGKLRGFPNKAFYRLINVLRAAKQKVPEALLKFGTTVKRKQHDAYGAFFKDADSAKSATKIKFDD